MSIINYLSFYFGEIKAFSKLALLFGGLCLVVQMFLPQVVHAQTVDFNNLFDVFNKSEVALRFPESKMREPRYTIKVLVTAYSSTPDQTDDTPFITASNTTVRKGVVAANFLRFGTRLRMPDHFDDQVFIVEDRMNERFDKRLDIWMESREEAVAWGARYVTVEVL